MLDREKDGIYTTRINGVVLGALTRDQVINAVECYKCSAPRGRACIGIDKPHPVRRKTALKLYGLRPPEAVLDNKYVDDWYRAFRAYAKNPEAYNLHKRYWRKLREQRRSVPAGALVTRYECPICGGPHSRADHPPSHHPPARPARPGLIRIRK